MEEKKYMSSDEKKKWSDTYYRYLDSYMKFGLASLPKSKMPNLELDITEGCWTNDLIIHIGIGDADTKTNEELMTWVLFRLGHEMQHVLSTTDKSWNYGLSNGYKEVIKELSKTVEGKERLFRQEKDYDAYLKYLEKDKGIIISKNAIMQFVHFIINSLEDGRIERLRCIKRPGFKNYLVICRGHDWEKEEIPEEMLNDLSTPRNRLLIILNQLLTLSTMQLYQKGFIEACKRDSLIHKEVRELIPHIRKAVKSGRCRGCMEEGIKLSKKLSPLIIEAAKYNDFEKMMKKLIESIIMEQSFTADSTSEEDGDEYSDININIFGESDIENDSASESCDSLNSGNSDKEGDKNADNNLGLGKEKESKLSLDTSGENSKNNDSTESSDHSKSDTKSGENSENSDDKKGDSFKTEEESIHSDNESSLRGSSGRKSSKSVREAMDEALKSSKTEIDTSVKAGAIDKRKILSTSPINTSIDKPLTDLSDINKAYSYEVKFQEVFPKYKSDDIMPTDLMSQGNVLKRKVKKIFKNMERPNLREQKTGRIDAPRIYKLAMGQMDVFSKKQKADEFDGCCYILMDNSGSMGSGYRGSKRYHCCRAVSILENAFEDIMPLKIAAFDAYGYDFVSHHIIKNWSEHIPRNGTYNFLTNCNSGYGNKDGYSIRVAAKELALRPEKKKLLIILSDGLPTDYTHSEVPEDDVMTAVAAARKAGIEVVGIFFGNDLSDTDPDVITFKNMYQKNTIITKPCNIAEELVRIFKRFCFK